MPLKQGEKIKTDLKYFKYAVKKLSKPPVPEAAAPTQTQNPSY